MMLLALAWADAFALTVLVGAVALVLTVMIDAIFGRKKGQLVGGPAMREITERQDDLAIELAAIRADLAEIKASIAELDRLFKSVG